MPDLNPPSPTTDLIRDAISKMHARRVLDVIRTACPYIPVRQTLPEGDSILRYLGDSSIPRIIQEVCTARVYETRPGFAPKEGETVIDVGAHVGIYALHAARLLGRGGNLVAVEADPRNFALLRRNMRLADNVRTMCVNSALWSEAGAVTLHREKSIFGAHSVVFDRGGESVEVRAMTLDGLVKERGLTSVSLIKMDVEGAALEILKGGEETLRRFTPRIACAAYHTPDEADLISDFLGERGYDVETKGIVHSYSSSPESYVFARHG